MKQNVLFSKLYSALNSFFFLIITFNARVEVECFFFNISRISASNVLKTFLSMIVSDGCICSRTN